MAQGTTLKTSMIEKEMKRREDLIYTRFLTTLGVLIIIIVTILAVLNDLTMTRELIAFFAMGALLAIAGLIWSSKDSKKVQEAEEIYMDEGNDEEEGERFNSSN